MRWRYNKLCQLHHWSNDVDRQFIFNQLSGQTHVLSRLALDILELIKHEKIVDDDGVWSQLVDLYENFDPSDEDMRQHVLGMLVSLDELGLIEPSRSL
mgnify:CR=1 FL=1